MEIYIDYNHPDKRVRKALISYKAQKQRCYYKKNKDYIFYGAKGIKVEYSSKEFVKWFIEKCPKNLDNIVVGRIDHNKNYSLDNIEIIKNSDNSIERNLRMSDLGKYKTKKVAIIKKETLKLIKIAESVKEAAHITGMYPPNVSNIMNGKKIVTNGYLKK